MLRSVAVLVALSVALAACSSPTASSQWSFGPSLPPEPASASPAASASAPASPSVAPSAPVSPEPSTSGAPAASPSAAASASPGGGATQLTIGTRPGSELEFEPDEVSVPTGVPVSVMFQNLSSLPHNLTFNDPINVATSPIVDPGASETIQITAPAPGDYQFVCTLHPGMEGTLTVTPG